MDVGHLARDADLVVVEIGEVLLFVLVGPIAYLCQGFVAVGIGVDIGIPAVRLDFLQEVAAVPDEMGAFGVGTRPGEFVLAFFGKASSERVVGVGPDLGVAGWLFDFAVGQLAVDQGT